MFDENQEAFCIIGIIVFWILSLWLTPFFLIPAIGLVLYVVLDTEDSTVNNFMRRQK